MNKKHPRLRRWFADGLRMMADWIDPPVPDIAKVFEHFGVDPGVHA